MSHQQKPSGQYDSMEEGEDRVSSSLTEESQGPPKRGNNPQSPLGFSLAKKVTILDEDIGNIEV